MRAPFLVIACVLLLGACSAESSDPAPTPDKPAAPAVKDTDAPAPDAPAATEDASLPEVRYYELDKSCPYCRDIKAIIMGAKKPREGDPEPLVKTYEGKLRFSVRPAYDSTNQHLAEVEPFEFGPAGHGMVGLAADGTVLFTLEGHHINRAAIVDAIEKTLK